MRALPTMGAGALLLAATLAPPALAIGASTPVPPPRPFDLPASRVDMPAPATPAAGQAALGATPPAAPVEAAATPSAATPAPEAQPAVPGQAPAALPVVAAGPAHLRPLIAGHARANDVPELLVHRVIQRESRYNPRAVGRGGALGLMQIKLSTARRLGYKGDAEGLLDADQNMRYAVKYLAGAYRVADRNHDRAVSYYASGYYYQAKAKRMLWVYEPAGLASR